MTWMQALEWMARVAPFLAMLISTAAGFLVLRLSKVFAAREIVDQQAVALAALTDKVRDRATSEDLTAMRREMQVLTGRVAHVEYGLEHTASAADVAAVRGEIKTLTAEVRGLSDTLRRVENPLTLLIQHQLDLSRGAR